MPLQLHISTEQKVLVKLVPTTPGNKPAPVDGVPTWTMGEGGDETITLEPSADGLSCIIRAGDAPSADNIITVSADADMGEGITTITDTIELDVTDPMAANLGLVAEPPTLKDETAGPTGAPKPQGFDAAKAAEKKSSK